MSANALRGYIKTLRTERGVTQAEIADRIGMPLPTYKDWERGVTKDIKTPYLVRAVHFLRGSLEQIASISDAATTEDGADLARQLIVSAFMPSPAPSPSSDEIPEESSRLDRLLDLLEQGLPADEAARRVLQTQ